MNQNTTISGRHSADLSASTTYTLQCPTEFTVRSYSKQELAMLYFPTSMPHVATNHLTAWIKGCRPLHALLKALPAYNRNAKYYSAREVRLIVEYLGEP